MKRKPKQQKPVTIDELAQGVDSLRITRLQKEFVKAALRMLLEEALVRRYAGPDIVK